MHGRPDPARWQIVPPLAGTHCTYLNSSWVNLSHVSLAGSVFPSFMNEMAFRHVSKNKNMSILPLRIGQISSLLAHVMFAFIWNVKIFQLGKCSKFFMVPLSKNEKARLSTCSGYKLLIKCKIV